ncbi:peroxiredoxin family protein [Halohasta salina]|uniref:peroxiredoxin family protein n=1 Tax=Halohasta salina TaxID=2961621 RepID=UPI0020A39DA9|nr:redoxin domain-containing protein [Halohasta salina]
MYSKPTDLSVELANGGVGPDPLRLDALETAFVVVLFQRDHLCGNCREQVQEIAARYAEFRERNTAVVSVLPESKERAAEWAASYDLPFPVVADPDSAVADRFGQPVRFGFLGELHDLLGRMPLAVIIDLRGDEPRLVYSHVGNSPSDRPTVEGLLLELDHRRNASE